MKEIRGLTTTLPAKNSRFRRRGIELLPVFLFLALSPSLTQAQVASFTLLPSVKGYEGYASMATGISVDGKWIAGTLRSGTASRGFRWQVGTGVAILAGTGTTASTAANGISDSGNTVVGYTIPNQAQAWVKTSLVVPPPVTNAPSQTTGVSGDDGTLAGWFETSGTSGTYGFTKVGSKVTSYQKSRPGNTRFHAISPNGKLVAGTDGALGFIRNLSTDTDTPLQLNSVVPTGVANDGTAVGYKFGTSEIPLRWDQYSAFEIPPFQGSKAVGRALGISDDRQWIVGWQNNAQDVSEAFLWNRTTRKTYALKAYLNRIGAGIPENVALRSATSVRTQTGGVYLCGTANDGTRDYAFRAAITAKAARKKK